MRITKEYRFEAAHHLPNVEPGHPCGRNHGHTYHVVLVLEGPVLEREGWVQDYGDVSYAWRLLEPSLDHRDLNDLMTNPTAELLAAYIGRWLAVRIPPQRAEPLLPLLVAVTVRETETSSATWERA